MGDFNVLSNNVSKISLDCANDNGRYATYNIRYTFTCESHEKPANDNLSAANDVWNQVWARFDREVANLKK